MTNVTDRTPKAPATGSDFGRKLQEARGKSGLSQRDVAQRLDTNVTTVSRYEIGAVLPSVAMAAQLAKAVDASLDQLTGLAEADTELVRLARRLSAQLTEEQQVQLCGVLAMVGK